ncbi:hypothetical protein A6V36_32350 [Paraburkholderia ginsengiterrae]|uniref:Uncharacterized protein n=1 Tax=Paraburkholderia ginsengiterrae TaxID=1462993 RepID=A0A1A9N9W4_9BURK|nr:hypothetical protein A6V36_32350 [Paraburkholderia ginsengiterrae]OAJ61350.1 hypothetical protein A6V37_25390 [Paraburkholderia ginsengiterrae]
MFGSFGGSRDGCIGLLGSTATGGLIPPAEDKCRRAGHPRRLLLLTGKFAWTGRPSSGEKSILAVESLSD